MKHVKHVACIIPLLILLTGCITVPFDYEAPYVGTFLQPPGGHAARVSSTDKTGANNDNVQILPGETITLADIKGSGIIRHIWTTTNTEGPIGRTLIVRMYWDGSDVPAVEVPYGDFFGAGNGMNMDVNSWPITTTSLGRSRNCWWHMPFADGAKITLTNEGPLTHGGFYYHIDYLALDDPPLTDLRFHACYNQAYPADFKDNYMMLDTTGEGYYMGVVMSVEGTKPQWWGEGDEWITADDYAPIIGTGTEDYFCDAWGMHEHATPWHGCPMTEGFDAEGLRTSMYRFHILDPIPFKKKIQVSIEHGTQNDRADNISSVVFWHQVPPAAPFKPMPEVEDRLLGNDRFEYIIMRAWQLATADMPNAREQITTLLGKARNEENIILIKGLLQYRAGITNPTDEVLHKMSVHLAELEDRVESLSPDARYTSPVIDMPTDNDNPVAVSTVKAHRMLERAYYDMKQKVAVKRGLEPGDEIVVEVRDSLGRLTPPPAYQETADFTNSYAKADDTHLMGTGARFTYGNAEPSWARFTPDIPQAGRYEVFVIFSYGANADDTRYEIKHLDGITVVPLKQRGRPGTEGRNNLIWHSLGIYTFEQGQNIAKGSVTLHASPGTAIPNPMFEYRAYADAVRFVYVEK